MHTVSEETTQSLAAENLAESIAACREQATEMRRGAAELEATATRWETISDLNRAGLMVMAAS